MDGIAVFTGLFGMVIGAASFHHAMKRRWWALTSVLSTGAAGILLMVTEGPRSQDERIAVSAAFTGLLATFVIAVIMQRRQARRAAAATRRP